MSKLKKEYQTGLEKCWYDSSNILYSEYNDKDFTMTVVFKNGIPYTYKDVNVNEYLLFREDDSQGKALNKYIKKYEFTKGDKLNTEPIINIINEEKRKL